MSCSVEPYIGEEAYCFVSYCRKDSKIVFPIMERLSARGCRLWYDRGIEIGEDWQAELADRLQGASACIAFLSEAYMRSENCLRELYFAVDAKKHFLPVRLEKITEPPKFKLYAAKYQYLSLEDEPDMEALCSRLCSAWRLAGCINSPRDAGACGNGAGLSAAFNFGRTDKAGGMETVGSSETVELVNTQEICTSSKIYAFTVQRTGEEVTLQKQIFIVGKEKGKCDFAIRGNSLISRVHARFLIDFKKQRAYVYDLNSVNHTYVNGRIVKKDAKKEVKDGDILRLADEEVIFHIYNRGSKG